MARSLFVLLVASLCACDGGWLSVEVESREVCVVDLDVTFPPGSAVTSMQTTLGEDDLGIQLDESVQLDVEVASVLLVPNQGIENLEFVDRLAIELGGAEEASLPTLSLIELGPQHRGPDGALFAEPSVQVDVTSYVSAGELSFAFDLQGQLPEQVWRATMDLCLGVTASYDVGLPE